MKYQVKAMREGGQVQSLTIDASSASVARQTAQMQGFVVISTRANDFMLSWMRPSVPKFQLVLFSHELQVLLKAGLNVVEALEVLAEREQRTSAKDVLIALLTSLREGHTLSHAMATFPNVFPPFYVASIRASETSGEISSALSRYVEYQSNIDLVKKKIISASVYPALLIGFGMLVLLFLLGYVIPRFSRIYADYGGDLTFATQLLLGWGQLIEQHGMMFFSGLSASICLLAWWFHLPETRACIMRLAWKIPAIGGKFRLYQLARLYRTLAMLLKSGIPVVTALDMTRDLIDVSMKPHLAESRREVSEGLPLSEALEHHGMATAVAFRLTRVAERTGDMSEMLEHTAKFHEEEMIRWVDVFTRLFEPILMAAIGLVIGTVVLLMYMPIFELAGSIQ